MIVFPELRYCFYGITGIDACESRGYQIQVRLSSGRVRTGADAACTVENPIPL